MHASQTQVVQSQLSMLGVGPAMPDPILHWRSENVMPSYAMRLTIHEKKVIGDYLTLLMEADEPKAMLGVLHRIAERKGFCAHQHKVDRDPARAERWRALAEALAKVMREMRLPETGIVQHPDLLGQQRL
jgi:hypothetical protein